MPVAAATPSFVTAPSQVFTPSAERGVGAHRLLDARARDRQHVGQRHVRQRVGRGARHRARHVAHAVVHDVVHHVTWDRRASSRARSRSTRPDRSRCRRARRPAASPRTSSAVTRCGAFAPGHEHGADHEVGARARGPRPRARDDITVWMRPRQIRSISRRRSTFLSTTTTSACMPAAISAAFHPAMPPPSTTTVAGATPLAPPISTPRPPWGRSRYFAPSCGAIRPAISDIGASSGSRPSGSLHRLVGDGAHASLGEEPRQRLVGREVQVGEQARDRRGTARTPRAAAP